MRRMMILKVFVFISMCLVAAPSARADNVPGKEDLFIKGVSVGMKEARFFKVFPKNTARTYRSNDKEQWITYGYPKGKSAEMLVTFQFREGILLGWQADDRKEVIREFLGEFCSQGIEHGMPKIFEAINDVLERISLKDFINVTDRDRPVMFTEYYDSGTARFANTAELFAAEEDAPAFRKGLTIIKLSSALNDADSATPIKGVLAHELAHRILEHAKKPRLSCDDEREANRLIKQWGFGEEFKQASKAFGRKEGEPSSCQK